MKGIIISMVFFLVFGKAICEKPMPTYADNPQWNVVYSGFFNSGCYTATISLMPDTFICGKAYSFPHCLCTFANCKIHAYSGKAAIK